MRQILDVFWCRIDFEIESLVTRLEMGDGWGGVVGEIFLTPLEEKIFGARAVDLPVEWCG